MACPRLKKITGVQLKGSMFRATTDMTTQLHLQNLLDCDDPWTYKLDDGSWVTLDDWAIDDAIAVYKGGGASLKAALQAYKCNAFLSVCHLLVSAL